MIKELEKLVKTANAININISQAFYLWALKEGLSLKVDISRNDLSFLVNLDLVNGDRLSKTGEDFLNSIEFEHNSSLEINGNLPKLNSQTGEIVKRLAIHFLGNRLTEKEFSKLSAYVKNDLQVPFFFMFFEMFPTADSKKNEAWDKHFGATWDNVTLRKVTAGSIKKLNKIWKSKDFGIFLLGTHMFIQESFNENSGKYFIKSIENYFKEYQHWYDTAEEQLNQGKLDHIVKESKTKTNTFIL